MKPAGPQGLPYNGGVPRHWNCRSAEIPITYTWEELGITGIGETRRVVEGGERASMFGPTKHRSFDSWLGSLEPEEQDSVLGSKRLGEAFRSGQLTSVKQMVDAATGRPLLMREMEEFGLIPPRYPARVIGAGGAGAAIGGGSGYVSPEKWIEDIRQQILAEYKDPRSDYRQIDRAIDKLEYEKIDLQEELKNNDLGLVPLTSAEVAAKRARIKAVENEQLQLRVKEKSYFARKYIAPLTSGRANINVIRGEQARDLQIADLKREQAIIRRDLDAINAQIADLKQKGKPVTQDLVNERIRLSRAISDRNLEINRAMTPLKPRAERAIDHAVDLLSDMLGDNSTLVNDWRGAQDSTYWEGLLSSERFDVPELKNLHQAGPKEVVFAFGKDTAYRGGGSRGFVTLKELNEDSFHSIIHELGHHLELTDETTMRRVMDYIRVRTGPEFGNPTIDAGRWKWQYGEEQTGGPFVRPYCGAGYGWNMRKPEATEWLSVALEDLAARTVPLAQVDPMSFEFMLRYLTNDWATWQYSGVFGG